MARPKGLPKTGGRKKGTPNKATQEFIAVLERRNFSPADALIDVYRRAMKAYENGEGASSGDGPDMTFKYLEIAAKSAGDLMSYRYPKRKAIEHTGEDGQPLINTLIDLVKASSGRKDA